MSELHLNVNILNSGIAAGAWRYPGTDPVASYSIEHYVSIAKKAEEATLDAVFLADGPVLEPNIRYRPGNSFEPSVLLARIAAETDRIGLIGTLSSSYNDPEEIARRLGDLDYLSGGRFGWNVVTTAGPVAAANFGREGEPDHALRYSRAKQVVDRVNSIWDRRRRSGEHTSAQGRPVIVQAGGSADGRKLAAQVAEVVFSVDQHIDSARLFRKQLRDGAVGHGRHPDDIVVLPGLSTVIGSTEAEAAERRRVIDQLLPQAYARARLSAQLGIDLDDLHDDEPIPRELLSDPTKTPGSQSFNQVVRDIIDRENPTLRQLLLRLSGSTGHRIVSGTPEQIADDIELWFRTGAADGFNIMPDVLPSGFTDLAEQLIPELRRRGLFRKEYSGDTLRDHLGLSIRPLPDSAEPSAHIDAAVPSTTLHKLSAQPTGSGTAA